MRCIFDSVDRCICVRSGSPSSLYVIGHVSAMPCGICSMYELSCVIFMFLSGHFCISSFNSKCNLLVKRNSSATGSN